MQLEEAFLFKEENNIAVKIGLNKKSIETYEKNVPEMFFYVIKLVNFYTPNV